MSQKLHLHDLKMLFTSSWKVVVDIFYILWMQTTGKLQEQNSQVRVCLKVYEKT
uniref:Uncharacterized protein n=1 Tax=Anguilla anguilla TaxID=7936 RepID=A0A0E9WIX2_ANGAN